MSALLGAATASVAGYFAYLLYLSHNLKAPPWERLRLALMELAREQGLDVQQDGKSASGTMNGLPVELRWLLRKGRKSRYVELRVCLELPGCPGDLYIAAEDLFSGVVRALGESELSLGDPRFDACMWVHGERDSALEFLTPQVKEGLLRATELAPEGQLQHSRWEVRRVFQSPLWKLSRQRKLFEALQELSASFGDDFEGASGAGLGLVSGRVRSFALTSLLVWLLLLGIGAGAPLASWSPVLSGVAVLGLVFSLLGTFLGAKVRVLLQSFYAFVSSCLLLGLGLSFYQFLAGFWQGRELVAMLMPGGVALFLSWGARHFLKALEPVHSGLTSQKETL